MTRKELSFGHSKNFHGMFSLFLLLVFLVFSGCDPAENSVSESTQPTESRLDVRAIFQAMVTTYRTADRYTDQAVLYMSYRLNGQPIQEPQPWAFSLDSGGKISARLFNAQLQCDGKQLSCYVYDIASENLDQQRLLLPVDDTIPLTQLFDDKIAEHFLSGFSEMPLDTSKPEAQVRLIPPTIGLLTCQVPPKWLNPDVKLEQCEDSDIDGRPCYVLRCLHSVDSNEFVDLWIDKENSTLWQMALPLNHLAPKVRESDEIENLRLVARFHEASFSDQKPDSFFALAERASATPVSRFVKIPEPLPAETIGNPAPPFQLLTQSGRELEKQHFEGKTTLLMWIGGGNNVEEIHDLNKVSQKWPSGRHHFGVVYSEPHRASYATDVHAMNLALNEVARETKIPFYYDSEMVASTQFGLRSFPGLIILDSKGKVQYAKPISGEWQKDTIAAIERIDKGENVAEEMLVEYRKFLDDYHAQLQRVQYRSGSTKEDILAKSQLNTRGRISVQKIWENTQLQRAGNLLTSTADNVSRIWALDGWRTIVELDGNGVMRDQISLSLPEGAGVSMLRSSEDTQQFLGFMPQSEHIFLFDKSWRVIETISAGTKGVVVDAAWKGNFVMVAFSNGNVELFDAKNTSQPTSVSKLNVTQLLPEKDLAIARGELVDVESGKRVGNFENWELFRAHSSRHGVCLLGTSADGEWHALGTVDSRKVDSNGPMVVKWSGTIGPQDFDFNLESVSSSPGERSVAWAIANSNANVHVFDGQGNWLGDVHFEGDVLGMRLAEIDQESVLYISQASGLSCWKMSVLSTADRSVVPNRLPSER